MITVAETLPSGVADGKVYNVVEPPDPPVDIRDPVNRFRGIIAYPSLDTFGLRPWGRDPVEGARYLQLEYDSGDLLGSVPEDGTHWNGSLRPGALSLARVSVVAEVFP